MNATEKYIDRLSLLKYGDLGLLRKQAGNRLDETVDAFDLFAGLWWPLRKESQRAPRREIAWLIAKLYAFAPVLHSEGATLPLQMRHCQPKDEKGRIRFRNRFDNILISPINNLEHSLQWALQCIQSVDMKLDWVKLTDDLSIWERIDIRRGWAMEYLKNKERE